MLHLQLCSRALCSLISRAHEGLWEQGRCDPSWQMVHTLLCRESLKEEGSQSHSAHQSQPQASHLWLRGFPQGVPEKAWGWQLQGHVLYPSPSSKAWWFHHLSYGGVLAASWGFLLRPLLLPQTLEGAVMVAYCQWETCNKEDFSGFISPERQWEFMGKKGQSWRMFWTLEVGCKLWALEGKGSNLLCDIFCQADGWVLALL